MNVRSILVEKTRSLAGDELWDRFGSEWFLVSVLLYQNHLGLAQ